MINTIHSAVIHDDNKSDPRRGINGDEMAEHSEMKALCIKKGV